VGRVGERDQKGNITGKVGSRGVEKLNLVKANLHRRWPAAKLVPAFSL
jgi:hypothetical protein